MSSLITQAVSKRLIAFASLAIAFLVISACVSTPAPPPIPKLTQLQIRQIQTRKYSDINTKGVMKAVIAALQDDGFIVSNADLDLGLISASVESYQLDKATKGYVEFWYGAGQGTYQTTKRIEASITVHQHGETIKVRINLLAKAITNAGGLVWSQPIYNPKVYQNLFAKVDKAIYLEKQNL